MTSFSLERQISLTPRFQSLKAFPEALFTRKTLLT